MEIFKATDFDTNLDPIETVRERVIVGTAWLIGISASVAMWWTVARWVMGRY